MTSKRKGGESISIYLSDQMLQELDRRKGPYFSRSRFVTWALSEYLLKGNNITDGIGNLIQKIPQGASVPAAAPSGKDSTPSNPPSPTEELTSVR